MQVSGGLKLTPEKNSHSLCASLSIALSRPNMHVLGCVAEKKPYPSVQARSPVSRVHTEIIIRFPLAAGKIYRRGTARAAAHGGCVPDVLLCGVVMFTKFCVVSGNAVLSKSKMRLLPV